MTKSGEIQYLKNIGEHGIRHAAAKPFSDPCCHNLLAQIGLVMSLLPSPPAKLLDLGCGTGWTSCFFAKRGYEVLGIDIAEDMISNAVQRKKTECLTTVAFKVSDYEHLKLANEFDCAVFFDSLHHSEDEEKAILTAYNALKPGGICITSEPGKGHAKSKAAIQAMKDFNVTEKDMPPGKIIRLGKKAGFKMFKVYPHSDLIMNCLYTNHKTPLLKTLFRMDLFRYVALNMGLLLNRRLDGIVVMRK